ncbi:TonB family protein [Novosphingobium sp. FSY-8]|uniref:TonB family protein n=1 Tax=Novosphingobium ovatum TaxID=1908523 RepID=A0ABW9XEP6_9SPHN|nr:energy transducer TonB [Novosphingobium ovatum]NBC37017.1 TonB family protein [Novosphingobium ovatum]
MSAALASDPVPTRWGGALGMAAAGHAVALAGVLWLGYHAAPKPEEPAILVELPPLPPAMAQAVAQAQAVAPQTPPDQPESTPVEAPRIAMPLPADAVTVPPKVAPQPQVQPAPQPAPVAQPAPAPAPVPAPPAPPAVAQASVPSPSIGDDPRAQKAQANYYQQLMAYLARRKDYPAEARQARQQGVVTVRFTIDQNGNISGETIKRGSGFAVLDSATLALLRRVSPVPPIPRDMRRDSITLSLPIEYSLTSK